MLGDTNRGFERESASFQISPWAPSLLVRKYPSGFAPSPNERVASKHRTDFSVRITVVDYPDHRLAIRYNGGELTYRTFDKVRQIDWLGAIADYCTWGRC